MFIIKSPRVVQLTSFGYFRLSNAHTKQNAGNDVAREAAPWPAVFLQKMGQVLGRGWSLERQLAALAQDDASSNCAEAEIHTGKARLLHWGL